MKIRKALFHIQTAIVILWYRLIYGSRLVLGRNLSLRNDFNLMIAENATVSIGNSCFFNSHCTIDSEASVSIGNCCLFAENVKIYDNYHRFAKESVPIKDQGTNSASISIGNNCWLASNVVVLKGADIGNNCVIGANCIISSRIPDGSIVRNSLVQTIEQIDYR